MNQMYEQQNLKQKTVKLKVGGQATVYKGTKLKIRCPVKKYERSLIQWAKGDKMVPKNGKQKRKSRFANSGMKAFVTKKGSLRIPAIGYQDAGIYTCMGKSSRVCQACVNSQHLGIFQNKHCSKKCCLKRC